MTSVARLLFAFFLVSCALSCASSPDPVFYALSARAGRALSSPPLRVEVRRVGLPSYLDRPQIVRRRTLERLDLGSDERWGGPLDEMTGATLVEDLAARLPTANVYTDSGSIAAAPDVRVEVQIAHFELTDDGSLKLLAQVALSWANSTTSVRMIRPLLSLRPLSARTADLVAAMSVVLGDLSDAIASGIAAGPP